MNRNSVIWRLTHYIQVLLLCKFPAFNWVTVAYGSVCTGLISLCSLGAVVVKFWASRRCSGLAKSNQIYQIYQIKSNRTSLDQIFFQTPNSNQIKSQFRDIQIFEYLIYKKISNQQPWISHVFQAEYSVIGPVHTHNSHLHITFMVTHSHI
jgi:hypothetical protein